MSDLTADQLLQKLRRPGSLPEILEQLKPAEAMALLVEPCARRQRRSLERLMTLHRKLSSVEARSEALQELCALLKSAPAQDLKPEMRIKIAVALLDLDQQPASPAAKRTRPRTPRRGNLEQSQGLLNRFLEFITAEKRREAMGPLPVSAMETPSSE